MEMININYYLRKYVGKYRVKSEIDQSTNDFCRDEYGELCNPHDIYIKCTSNIKIFHYGRNILEVYIPSIGKGHNILKAIAEEVIGLKLTHYSRKKKNSVIFDYDALYKDMNNLLFDIYDTDVEIVFKIKDENLDNIISYLKPQTSGASISPVSPKNLSIGKGDNKYQYSNAQIEEYKKITASLGKRDILFISKINNKFIDKIIRKSTKKTLAEIKADMKYKQLKVRDYIYSEGFEKEYLEFLNKEIQDYEKNKDKN